MARLGDAEIEERLRAVSGWKREGDAIAKTFKLPSFREAVAFVGRVAQVADAADHHPDILIRYRRVTLTYSTHSEGGLTQKDFDGAAAAERAAGS